MVIVAGISNVVPDGPISATMLWLSLSKGEEGRFTALLIVTVVSLESAPAGISIFTPYKGLAAFVTSTVPPDGPIVAEASGTSPLHHSRRHYHPLRHPHPRM